MPVDQFTIVKIVEALASFPPPSRTSTVTLLGPAQVLGEVAYETPYILFSPGLNANRKDATVVACPQSDMAETTTVYLARPVEQLLMLP
jgi:hypothetical protein